MQFSESPKSGKEIFLNPVKLWQGNKIEPIKCRLIDDRVEKKFLFFYSSERFVDHYQKTKLTGNGRETKSATT